MSSLATVARTTDPRGWLQAKGFDPESDLCKAIETREFVTATAMFAAAEAGELGVCRFLHDQGAAGTIRSKNNHGQTPMWAATSEGHVDVARWLFAAGAAEDVHTSGRLGGPPILLACEGGHLDVVAWLFAEAGAARDTRVGAASNAMWAACEEEHFDVALWLLLHGNSSHAHSAAAAKARALAGGPELSGGELACLAEGFDASHFDLALLLEDTHECVGRETFGTCSASKILGASTQLIFFCASGALCRYHIPPLLELLGTLLKTREGFARHFLPATRFGPAPAAALKGGGGNGGDGCDPASAPVGAARSAGSCLLLLLDGHCGLVVLIADFAGVVRGRPLRTAREAWREISEWV
jgi:hypothetical protein